MEQNKESIELINSKNTELLVDFIQNLKDENGNTIPEFKNLSTDNEDIKDIIVTVVNYFKQDTYKPLHYNNHEITNISSFIKAMKKNMIANETDKNIINVFKLMFSFYEKIYNENIKIYNESITNKDTSDMYAYYTIKDSIVVKDFIEEYLLKNSIKERALKNFISILIKKHPEEIPDIVQGFVEGCLLKEQNVQDIGSIISELINDNLFISTLTDKNSEKISKIIKGFVRGYLSKNNTINNDVELQKIIFTLINNNQYNTFYIVKNFVENCLLNNQDIRDIGNIISVLITQLEENKNNF